MNRTITVKGTGRIRIKPDYIAVSMEISNTNKVYDAAMNEAANRIEKIEEAVCRLGFQKTDLKTIGFNVSTEYETVHDKDGRYCQQFSGYNCRYDLSLSFDFDSKMLAAVIAAIAESNVKPEMNIEFTVKDSQAVSDKLLGDAVRNAKHKADVLCVASNCKLSTLVSIDYNWGELDLVSQTRYNLDESIVPMTAKARCVTPDITPDDINVSDTVTLVWEIE